MKEDGTRGPRLETLILGSAVGALARHQRDQKAIQALLHEDPISKQSNILALRDTETKNFKSVLSLSRETFSTAIRVQAMTESDFQI